LPPAGSGRELLWHTGLKRSETGAYGAAAEAVNGAAYRSGDALASVRISKRRSPKLAVPDPEARGDPVKATELNGELNAHPDCGH
jgi:hypothetical protein